MNDFPADPGVRFLNLIEINGVAVHGGLGVRRRAEALMAMEIDREHDVSDWRWKSSFCLLKGSVRLLKGSPIDFMILSASS